METLPESVKRKVAEADAAFRTETGERLRGKIIAGPDAYAEMRQSAGRLGFSLTPGNRLQHSFFVVIPADLDPDEWRLVIDTNVGGGGGAHRPWNR